MLLYCILIAITVMLSCLCTDCVRVSLRRDKTILTARFYHTLNVVVNGCGISYRAAINLLVFLLVKKYVVIAVSESGRMVLSCRHCFIIISLYLRHLVSLKNYLTYLVLRLLNPCTNKFLL